MFDLIFLNFDYSLPGKKKDGRFLCFTENFTEMILIFIKQLLNMQKKHVDTIIHSSFLYLRYIRISSYDGIK